MASLAACSGGATEDCSGTAIPYDVFSHTFPLVEFCVVEGQGFVPFSKDLCLALPHAAWRVRPGASPAQLARTHICPWVGKKSPSLGGVECLIVMDWASHKCVISMRG
jgi:hypothetical protein